jgi:hypothetical protein
MDASVLIDYCAADRTILRSISEHVGRLIVPSIVLAEVDALDEAACGELTIDILEPPIEMLLAANDRHRRLTVQDFVCFKIAHENGWTCVTNDGLLRARCVELNVAIMWGLEPMATLVRDGHLSIEEATATAEAMHASNPYFISRNIVDTFVGKLTKGEPGSR